jgi:hypothetical protein
MSVLSTFARWLGLFLLSLLATASAPFLVLFTLPFCREDFNNVLPSWLQWFNTPDDRGVDQGMYEHQVYLIYHRFGWVVKTWYWLGVRNQLNGLFAVLAPTTGPGKFSWFTANAAPYPRTKSPFTPGRWLMTALIDGRGYFEFDWVWKWSATHCGIFRAGWKLEPLTHAPGPVMFLLQLKPWLTIDSTT